MSYPADPYHLRNGGSGVEVSKAVLLDRDGTINVEKHYLHRVEDFEFLPGVTEALRKLQAAGFLLIIITNQSGIARGFYTEEDFLNLNRWMCNELENHGVRITDVFYCPHLPDGKVEKYRKVCNCRKPALGLFEKAAEKYDIDMSRSWAIGDKIRDCALCEKSDCRGFLIGSNENAAVIRDVKNGIYRNVRYADDLLQAADFLIGEENPNA